MRYEDAGWWNCANCGQYIAPDQYHTCIMGADTESVGNYVPRGWECPKCGRVYSPNTFECYHCNRGRFTYHPDSTETIELTEEQLAALRGELAGDDE